MICLCEDFILPVVLLTQPKIIVQGRPPWFWRYREGKFNTCHLLVCFWSHFDHLKKSFYSKVKVILVYKLYKKGKMMQHCCGSLYLNFAFPVTARKNCLFQTTSTSTTLQCLLNKCTVSSRSIY